MVIKMYMTIEEAHNWEDDLRKSFKEQFPDEKIPFFGSTWKAIDWLEERVYEKIVKV